MKRHHFRRLIPHSQITQVALDASLHNYFESVDWESVDPPTEKKPPGEREVVIVIQRLTAGAIEPLGERSAVTKARN